MAATAFWLAILCGLSPALVSGLAIPNMGKRLASTEMCAHAKLVNNVGEITADVTVAASQTTVPIKFALSCKAAAVVVTQCSYDSGEERGSFSVDTDFHPVHAFRFRPTASKIDLLLKLKCWDLAGAEIATLSSESPLPSMEYDEAAYELCMVSNYGQTIEWPVKADRDLIRVTFTLNCGSSGNYEVTSCSCGKGKALDRAQLESGTKSKGFKCKSTDKKSSATNSMMCNFKRGAFVDSLFRV